MDRDPAADQHALLLEQAGFLRALARGLVFGEAEADDLEQATWLAALQRPPSEARALSTWLARVARNLAVGFHRANHRRAAREAACARCQEVPSAADLAGRHELQLRLLAAIRTLPGPFQVAIQLRYFEGLPPRAMARRLGEPVETVKSRLKRALAQLRKLLDERHGGERCVWLEGLAPFLAPWVLPGQAAGGTAAAAGGMASTASIVLGGLAMQKVLLAGGLVLCLGFLATLGVLLGGGEKPSPAAAAPGTEPTAETPRGDRAGEMNPIARIRLMTDHAVEVEDNHGRPLTGACVALCDSRLPPEAVPDRIPQARTDAAGRAWIPGTTGDQLILLAPGHMPMAFPAELGAVPQRLRLPPPMLGGVVRAAPPPEPVRLRLVGHADPTRGWGEMALRFLAGRGWGEAWLDLRIGEDGGFSVCGLEPGLAHLEVEGIYRFWPDMSRSLEVTLPARGLLVELQRPPLIRGRTEAAHAGLEGSSIRIDFLIRSGEGRTQKENLYTTVGREFAIPVEVQGPVSLHLVIFGQEGESALVSLKRPLDAEPNLDLGRIVVGQHLSSVTFEAVARGGGPVSGARIWNEGAWIGETDAAGKTAVPVAPASCVLVAAEGHDPVELLLPEAPPQEMRVTLDPATTLRVVVRGAPPRELARLTVGIRLPGGLLEWAAFRNLEVTGGRSGRCPGRGLLEIGGGTEEWGIAMDPGSLPLKRYLIAWGDNLLLFRLPGEGVLSFRGICLRKHEGTAIVAGITLEIALHDRFHEPIVIRKVHVSPGIDQEVVIPVPRPPRTVEGKVLDGAGRPVAGAVVTIRSSYVQDTGYGRLEPDDPPKAVTDDGGYFSLSGVYSPTAILSIRAAGFCPVELKEDELSAPGGIRLELARELWIEVVDAQGRLLHAEVELCDQPGRQVRSDGARKVGRRHLFPAAPVASLQATVQVGEAKRVFPIPPAKRWIRLTWV